MSDIIVIPAETSTIAVDVLDPTISITVSMAAVGVGGGGGGGVSSVSATGQQGVTASVASPTTTPSITIGLGAITPTSVAASGTVTGSNLSGTNTGDQVLTAGTLSGRGSTAGTGTAQTITLGTNLSMSGNVLNATGGGGGNVPSGGAAGQFLQTDGTTPSWQHVQTVRLYARNSTGSTIAKGSVVYISSADGNNPLITKALATTDATSSKTIGIVEQDMLNGADGYVVTEGFIDGMDTQGIPDGSTLWLSATVPGGYTTTKTQSPNHLVFVGYSIKASAGNGRIYVVPQNGYELDELHDVLITTPANNEVLTYESSTQLWTNKPNPQGTVTAVTGTAPVSSSGGTTPAISLSAAYGDTLNPYASKPAAQVLASPSGAAGVPTFRALVASDVPTLNQNTTGTAANVTGVVGVANGGTGATTLTGYLQGNGTGAVTGSATIPGSAISGNITGNAGNVTGTVAIANGGTGQTTATAALNALLPSQTGNTGKVLSTDGTSTSWASVGGTGTVTSVAVSGGTTGLTTSGGPITTAGTITLSGTLALANGGTGATTAATARTNLGLGNVENTALSTWAGSSNITTVGNITAGSWNGTAIGINRGGTNITSYTKGDMIFAFADNVLSKLGGNTTATRKLLTQIGDGTQAFGPEWYTFDQVLPTQTGNSGKFLTTNGTNASWGTPAGGGTVTSVAVSGGTTGLTTSGGPITTSGTITLAGTLAVANGGTGATTLTGYVKGTGTTAMTASATIPGADISGNISGNAANVTGVVAIANGGTGQTTAATAINALLPSQSTNSGKFLTTDGTSASWATVSGTGTVTSVDVSGGTTGLTTSGGPITTSGTITLAGTLAVANGGTGQTTYTDGQLLIGNSTGNTLAKATLTAGTGISVTNGAGSISLALASGYGDTLFPFVSSRTAATVLAAPSGAAGTPSFRTLALADISTALSTWTGSSSVTTLGTITTGTWTGTAITVLNGGTGATTAATARTNLGLGNVENTALSTWAGSANIVTVGTITTGTWNGNTIVASRGGTGSASYTLGDLLYASATTTLTKLAGNTASSLRILTQTGTGAVSAAPAWSTFDQITPTQTGNAGDVLQTDGFTATWQPTGISGLSTQAYPKAASATSLTDGTLWYDATTGNRTGMSTADGPSAGFGVAINGTVYHTSTNVGNDANTSEKIALSLTRTFFKSPDYWIRVSAYFKFAVNGNSKTIRIRIGKAGYTTTYFDAATVTSSGSGSVVYMEVLITRDATNWISTGFVRSTTGTIETVLDQTTFPGNWSILNDKLEIILQTGTATANNVIMRDALIEWGAVGG
jgi:hypothetical protein